METFRETSAADNYKLGEVLSPKTGASGEPSGFKIRSFEGFWTFKAQQEHDFQWFELCKKYFQKSGDNPPGGITGMRECGKTV
jgi:hypothetical protein